MAAIWARETPWRQGHFLSPEAVRALGLAQSNSPDDTCVVVVSHDCDLAVADLQVESEVEVIVGCHPQKVDGNYFWAKAPRTLHLDVLRDNAPAVVELTATAKRVVPKQALAAFTPDATYSFSGKSLSALRSWLAVRYCYAPR